MGVIEDDAENDSWIRLIVFPAEDRERVWAHSGDKKLSFAGGGMVDSGWCFCTMSATMNRAKGKLELNRTGSILSISPLRFAGGTVDCIWIAGGAIGGWCSAADISVSTRINSSWETWWQKLESVLAYNFAAIAPAIANGSRRYQVAAISSLTKLNGS